MCSVVERVLMENVFSSHYLSIISFWNIITVAIAASLKISPNPGFSLSTPHRCTRNIWRHHHKKILLWETTYSQSLLPICNCNLQSFLSHVTICHNNNFWFWKYFQSNPMKTVWLGRLVLYLILHLLVQSPQCTRSSPRLLHPVGGRRDPGIWSSSVLSGGVWPPLSHPRWWRQVLCSYTETWCRLLSVKLYWEPVLFYL